MENRKERLQAITLRTLACFSTQKKERDAWASGNILWEHTWHLVWKNIMVEEGFWNSQSLSFLMHKRGIIGPASKADAGIKKSMLTRKLEHCLV